MNKSMLVNRSRIVAVLAAVIVVLAASHALTQWIKYTFDAPTLYGIVPLFDMNIENNLPTFFATFQLLIAAAILSIIAQHEQRGGAPYWKQWTLLSALFLYLAADESASLHELMIRPISEQAGGLATGIFYFAWVIPGLIIVAALAVYFRPFLFWLPPRTRNLFFVAAALYIGGALGVEMFQGRRAEVHGQDNLFHAMSVLLEETMEKSGVLVFIAALLGYIERYIGVVRITVESQPVGITEEKQNTGRA